MQIKIFYSWQSDTVSKYNRYFILESIEKALKKLKNLPETRDVEYVLQEGINNEPGSPPLADKITDERIPACDIFITDLSVINRKKKWVEWVLKKIKQSERAHANPNVLLEYGVALKAIGHERIIGVMNRIYGSPEDLPFDIKHLRFPILYSHSSKHEKKKEQEPFVNALRDGIKDITSFALLHYRQKYHPLLNWDSWEAVIPQTVGYVKTEKIEEIGKMIKSAVVTDKNVIRLLGLSGLGKTRILFEMFRANEEDDNAAMLTARMLYYDCNLDTTYPIVARIEEVINTEEEHIIILDNCPAGLCRKLIPMVKGKSSRVSLITIDNNPEEADSDSISGVNYSVIKKEDLVGVVDVIVNQDFNELPPDRLEKIKEFSQGIPMMAVLLGQSARNGERFLGRLDDKYLLDSLLGNFAKDPETRTLLKSSALFNAFGYQGELEPQLTFIATNKDITITDSLPHVVMDKFHGLINHYLSREIFEKRGRLLSMRPFPLAMYLAQEWLTTCTPERMMNMIIAIAGLDEPHRKSLSEGMAEQMKYLGYDKKALEIVERITGPDSPFDNAGVLNTELGSRLFRSFVEVNPTAIANNLYRNFIEKDTINLEDVVEGRRNLVWVLEKLCFDKTTFEKGIKVLYVFAVAENETWSNNATGQFLQLFKVMLAGTEATLLERIAIIEWGLSHSEQKFQELAVEAMARGLSYGHFSRMVGAENQGTLLLKDHEPSSLEIEQYWARIVNHFLKLIERKTVYANKAAEHLLESMRGLVRAGFADLILPAIQQIIDFYQTDWDLALIPLTQLLKYEEEVLTDFQVSQLKDLIFVLTKNDFLSKYKRVVKQHQLDYVELLDHNQTIGIVKDLAFDFLNSDLDWTKNVSFFFRRTQYNAYYFGKGIYEHGKQEPERIKIFIDLSLLALASIDKEQRDEAVLGGIFSEADQQIRSYIIAAIEKYSELTYLNFYLISLRQDSYEQTDGLFKLVDSGRATVQFFTAFSHNGFVNTNFEQIILFCKRLFLYNREGYEVAYKVLSNAVFYEPERRLAAIPMLKECIIELGIIKSNNSLHEFQWWEIIRKILEGGEEGEFAQMVNHAVIESITWKNSYHLDYDMKRTYSVLLERYFDDVWPEIAVNLLEKDERYIKYYGLKHILGASIDARGGRLGLISIDKADILFEWAKNNAPLAPARLAQMIPIFGEKNNNKATWHPLAKMLLDNFGQYEDVLSDLSSNINTFSWTGSIVPYLENQIQLMEEINDHSIPLVENWAKRNIGYLQKNIQDEKNKDEERRFR